MPPFFPQPPLPADGALRWLDVAFAVVAVACEPWALGFLALAFYSWLEREVRAVLAAAAPLLLALAASGALAVAARAAWSAPRLAAVDGGGLGLALRLLPGAEVLAVAAFVTYSTLVYGRRGAVTLALGIAHAAARGLGGTPGAVLAAGWVGGALLGGSAWLAAVRLFPRGRLARLRAARAARTP